MPQKGYYWSVEMSPDIIHNGISQGMNENIVMILPAFNMNMAQYLIEHAY